MSATVIVRTEILKGKDIESPHFEGGAQLVACTMTMDLLGIAESDLQDGIDYGGVATFLGEAQKSGTTLFI